ncbi:MAG TPA: GNAT family N-acetyltransferase [Blastocatellia bacterium]|nr:GNAT family N-acetyltransferase [Blastocatellia bacterium]
MNTQSNSSQKFFSRDVLLRDGAVLRMRPLRQTDREGLVALFKRCSPETIRYRFLRMVTSLPDSQLDQLVEVDGESQVALVITQGENADEKIVAVGRYYVLEKHPTVAEVSFLVEDAMQRRGIGSILLDALAELAREHGINRFAADVLADNRLMLSVFRKAGYALTSNISYGVTHLEFPITRSEVAEARREAQEAEAERVSLSAIFEPKTVAVIGASRDPASVGGALFRNLLRWGFTGTLYPINSSAASITGVRAYASIAELPETPELVFIAVPSQHVVEVARQCATAKVRALCVLTAGFAETGAEGRLSQKELVDVCRASGMRLVGPNCMGLVNTSGKVRLLGTFAPVEPPAGNVAMSSQSGALGLALMAQAGKLGLGVSSFISVGNKADVSGNDLLQFWESDEATDVILFYLESFGNPRRFARIARRVSRAKPIVAVKSGRTGAGARAASSHTAALASSDRAADALFAQTGIIRVDTLAEFFSVARLLAAQPIPKGKRMGVLTNGGGPGIIAVDAAIAAGLEIPQLSEATQSRLREVLPAAATVTNPVDMIASASPAHYKACLEILCDDPDLDLLLVIFIPPLATPAREVAQVMSDVLVARPNLQKTVAAVFFDPTSTTIKVPVAESTGAKASRSVPVYDFPESATVAMAAAVRYGLWRDTPTGSIADIKVDRDATQAIVANYADGGWLNQMDVAALLGAAGINVVTPKIARTAAEAAAIASEFNSLVAMKVHEPAVLHKSDVGGVLLNIAPADAAAGFTQLAEQLAAHNIKLEAASLMPMAKAGVEVLAGITHDPLFGPLVAFGSGGFLVELLDDVVFRVLPLTDRDASEMIVSTRAHRMLKGYRGAPEADIPAVEDLLLRLGALAEAVPQIAEIDLNPVIVHPHGEGLTMIDARIRLN